MNTLTADAKIHTLHTGATSEVHNTRYLITDYHCLFSLISLCVNMFCAEILMNCHI